MSYLEAAGLGEEVEVEATILKIGKRLSGCNFAVYFSWDQSSNLGADDGE